MNKSEHTSHSNIAIVKYWGKFQNQLPCNPSISFTLKNCKTFMSASSIVSDKFKLKYLFEGQENESFRDNILKRIKRLPMSFNKSSITIESRNTFPHSSGVASSASSMSCLVKILNDLYELKLDSSELSNYSRLLSGSACRSLKPGFQSWGHVDYLLDSSDEYSTSVEVDPLFHDLKDTVIIVDSGMKKISSTQGHQSMDDHPYKLARYEQARKNHEIVIQALKAGDWPTFSKVTKIEALSLHALMMSSTTPYFLMRPKSLEIINLIESKLDKNNFTFTMDAGANIHLLYRAHFHDQALRFLDLYSEKFESYIEDEILV